MPLDGKKHVGHRERLKQRFVREGLDSFEEHNILELILFYTIPQKDTNELAHDLLDRFGSLDGVFNAGQEQLMEVKGVGEHTALFLSMFPKLIDSYIEDRKQNETISGMQNVVEFAVRKLAFSQTECLLIIFIDNKQCMLNWHFLQEGMVASENLDIRTIVRMIMGTNTTQVLLARNYLKGKSKLGRSDVKIATELSDVLGSIGVGMFDYIVSGVDGKIATLKGNAVYKPKKDIPRSKVGDYE